jgi:carbon-monoxide dehydrogenase medium subunit
MRVEQEVKLMLARPGLPEFDLVKPKTSQEVFQLLEKNGKGVRLFMGGTDLFIQMRDRSEGPQILIDLKELPGMREISFDKKKGLQIGAAVTLNQLSAHSDVQTYYPVLSESADTVGNYQLRNRATLGGNICNASPSADMSPACLVYEGEVTLTGPKGDRQVQLDEFWIGPGQTTLKKDEYLSKIIFPPPPPEVVGRYLKLGRSRMGDLAIVGVAVLGYPDKNLPAGFQFRIGINSTAPTAYRVPEVEGKITQQKITPDVFHQAAEAAMEISAPIEDVRATAEYQKLMVRNLTYKALSEVWNLLK